MNHMFPQALQIGGAVVYQRLQDEAVLLDLNSQTYYGLDAVATEMWDLILEHHEVDVVIERLQALYDVDAVTLRRDLDAFIQSLMSAELLIPAEPRNIALSVA